MTFERSSGLLMHPTSLPGDYGIGSLDDAADRWLDWLARAGQRLWQIMPLGHTGYGDSPYQSFSAFAGNPLLVSLERLKAEGLLDPQVLVDAPDFPRDRVDFGWIYEWKWHALRRAHRTFSENATPEQRAELESFRRENAAWLDDYALFMALKDAHGGGPWNTWPEALRARDPDALASARAEHADGIELYEFAQAAFFRQWAQVREAARSRDIRVIGDLPIFVAFDSADVWAHPDLFHIDENGNPSVVAGVPPDYFSETGQLWGNPLYRWDRMEADGFAWWIERFRATLATVDIVRIDHFRGFEAYWEIPGGAPNAVEGRWVKAPGDKLLARVREVLGDLPIVAEDLGVITPEVEKLRDDFGLPGMKVLQFAFDSEDDHPYRPHNHVVNAVAYTGTHDNDTTRGWWDASPEERRDRIRRYFESPMEDIAWDLMRVAWQSAAVLAVAPLQDALDLGSEARTNLPGSLGGNWSWRYRDEQLTDELAERLLALTVETGRA